MKDVYEIDKINEFILSNRPERINAWMLANEINMSDDEYMLFAYKFYHAYPNRVIPVYRLFNFLKKKKYYEVGYCIIKRALEKFPNDKLIWKHYIFTQKFFENTDNRIDTLKRYIEKFPADTTGYTLLAKLMFDNDKKNEAIEFLENTLKTFNEVAIKRTLSVFYSNMLEYDKSVKLLEHIVEMKPDLSSSIELLDLYIKLGKYDRIDNLLDKMIYINEFYNSNLVYVQLSTLLCNINKNKNISDTLKNKVIEIITHQKINIDINENHWYAICLKFLHTIYVNGRESLLDVVDLVEKYKNLPMFNIALYPYGKTIIQIDNINITSLTYILFTAEKKYIDQLADIILKNINTILAKNSRIYYALLFSIIINNNQIRDRIIDEVLGNRDIYDKFIVQIAEKWNITRHEIIVEKISNVVADEQIKSMKVAICIAGQLRGYEQAIDSIHKYFHLSEYKADFFVSTWKNIGTHRPKLDQKSRNLPLNLYNAIKRHYARWTDFIKHYPTIGLYFNSNHYIDIQTLSSKYNTKNIILEDDTIYPFNSFINQEKMFYKWKSCISMVKDEYDIIIRIRPDFKINEYPSLSYIMQIYKDCLNNNTIYCEMPMTRVGFTLGCGDSIHIGKSSIMHDLLRIYCNVHSSDVLHYNKGVKFLGHYTIGAYVFQNGIRVKRLNVNANLVDKFLFTASEILPLLQKDVSIRKMTSVDEDILEACKKDIKEESSNTLSST